MGEHSVNAINSLGQPTNDIRRPLHQGLEREAKSRLGFLLKQARAVHLVQVSVRAAIAGTLTKHCVCIGRDRTERGRQHGRFVDERAPAQIPGLPILTSDVSAAVRTEQGASR